MQDIEHIKQQVKAQKKKWRESYKELREAGVPSQEAGICCRWSDARREAVLLAYRREESD